MNRRATPNPPADAAIFRGIIQKHLNGNASRRRKAGRRAGGRRPISAFRARRGLWNPPGGGPPFPEGRGYRRFHGDRFPACVHRFRPFTLPDRGKRPLHGPGAESPPARIQAGHYCSPRLLPPYTPLCPAGGRGVCFFLGEENVQGGAAAGRVKGPECGAAASEPDAGASGAFGYHGRLRAAPKAPPAFCLFRQLILFPWCCTIGSKEASKWTTLKRWRNGSARAGTS